MKNEIITTFNRNNQKDNNEKKTVSKFKQENRFDEKIYRKFLYLTNFR